MKILSLLLLALIVTLPSSGATLEDEIQAFNNALKTANPTGAMPFGRMIPLVDPATYPGGDAGLESMVQQMMSSSSSDAVQKAGADLLAAIRADRKARTDATKAQVDAVLAKVPDIVAQAQKPSDLDDVLGEIQSALPIGSPYGGGNVDDQTEVNRLNSTYQFVSQWQDYLSHRDSGNNQEALGTLRSLAEQRPPGKPIIPRSQILEKIAALEGQPNTPSGSAPSHPAPIDPILEGIKTLDDIAPAARKEMVLDGQSYDASRLNQIANRLAQAKYGLPVSLDLAPANSGLTPQPGFAHIDSMVLLYLLPLYLGPSAPAPTAGETVSAYLERVMNSAESATNLPLLQRVLAAKAQLAAPGQYSQGVQGIEAALNEEIAGQYPEAVQSYENALRASDANTPATLIGERLAAIKKDHAAELAEAAKAAQARPPPYYPVYNPYYRPGMPGYPGMGIPQAAMPPVGNTAAPPTAATVTTPKIPVPPPSSPSVSPPKPPSPLKPTAD